MRLTKLLFIVEAVVIAAIFYLDYRRVLPVSKVPYCGVFRHRGVQFHKARHNAQGRRGADILVEQLLLLTEWL